MSSDEADPVAEGWEALGRGDWHGAEVAFREALAVEETGRSWSGLGEALWWQGKIQACVEARERAYATYCREGNPRGASRSAMQLSSDYRDSFGNHAAAVGWLRRARRLVDDHGLERLSGWVLLWEAAVAPDPARGEVLAQEALACARRTADVDLELCAVSQIGVSLVEQGRVAEGVSFLDEATAGSLGSGGSRPGTAVFACCNTLVACTSCARFERVVQLVRAADRFSERYGCPYLHIECRTLYGAALVATGDWARAEQELLTAIEASADAFTGMRDRAIAALAGLRLAQGSVDEAQRLVTGLDEQREVAAVQARLHLAHDRPAAAEAVARRWLAQLGDQQLAGHDLLEALGEAEIAQGRAACAAERGATLSEFARQRAGYELGVARGERLSGRALLAAADAAAARGHLDAALVSFQALSMPLESARTRVLLAEALQSESPKAAVIEAQGAFSSADALGARPTADAAAALLRRLGASAVRAGTRRDGELTAREQEVLALLGEGLSNPEIAQRLYISRKTVEHHVARVLAKLGLRSRGEAAAEAARRLADRKPGRP